MEIKFYSRHDVTDEIKKGIEQVTNKPCSIEQDSDPFVSGFDIVIRSMPDNISSDNTVTVAGVFPAEILGEIIAYVQGSSYPHNFKIITFKYKRDRETNTVSQMSHVVVWDIKKNSPFKIEVKEVA